MKRKDMIEEGDLITQISLIPETNEVVLNDYPGEERLSIIFILKEPSGELAICSLPANEKAKRLHWESIVGSEVEVSTTNVHSGEWMLSFWNEEQQQRRIWSLGVVEERNYSLER